MTRRELFKAFIAAPFVAAAAPILAKVMPPKNPILSGQLGTWTGMTFFESSSKETVDAWSRALAKEVLGKSFMHSQDTAFMSSIGIEVKDDLAD